MTKEERRAYSREYYRKNREKILAEYREKYANDESFRKAKINSAEIYNETNKDKIKERKSKYYEKKKDKFREYFDEYYTQNKDTINGKRKYKWRKEKIETQKDICVN